MAQEAHSNDELEESIRRQINLGKMARGCVYQICPSGISSERPRCVAAPLVGDLQNCVLDTAAGLYSEFQRIRYSLPETTALRQAEPLFEEVLA